jgi:hypothetical protein
MRMMHVVRCLAMVDTSPVRHHFAFIAVQDLHSARPLSRVCVYAVVPFGKAAESLENEMLPSVAVSSPN